MRRAVTDSKLPGATVQRPFDFNPWLLSISSQAFKVEVDPVPGITLRTDESPGSVSVVVGGGEPSKAYRIGVRCIAQNNMVQEVVWEVTNVGTAPLSVAAAVVDNLEDNDLQVAPTVRAVNAKFASIQETLDGQVDAVQAATDAATAAADSAQAATTAAQQAQQAAAGAASQSALDTLSQAVAGKASQSALNTLSTAVAGKADASALAAKADASALAAKADASAVTALTQTVSGKADASALAAKADAAATTQALALKADAAATTTAISTAVSPTNLASKFSGGGSLAVAVGQDGNLKGDWNTNGVIKNSRTVIPTTDEDSLITRWMQDVTDNRLSVLEMALSQLYTPAALANLLGWYRSDTSLTTASSKMTAWASKSAHGIGWVPKAGSTGLDVFAATSTDPAFIRLNGTNDALKTNGNFDFGTTKKLTVAIVCRMRGGNVNDAQFIFATGPDIYGQAGSVILISRITAAASRRVEAFSIVNGNNKGWYNNPLAQSWAGWDLITLQIDNTAAGLEMTGTSLEGSTNGEPTGGTANLPTNFGPLYIGYGETDGSGSYAPLDVAEIFLVSDVLDPVQKVQNKAYEVAFNKLSVA